MHNFQNVSVGRQENKPTYYLDLFSRETLEAFDSSGAYVTGFRISQQPLAEQILPGDRFVCYLTRLSRFCGILEVKSQYFIDETPLFYPTDDPFVVRFQTRPLLWLTKEDAVPIAEDALWKNLSFTRTYSKSGTAWTGKLRNSLNRLSNEDGTHIENILRDQLRVRKIYNIDEARYRKFISQKIIRPDRIVTVTVPQEDEPPAKSRRESHEIQALIAAIGARMGFNIWIPRRDRAAVLQGWTPDEDVLLDYLPLNYDEPTLTTIEQIDVLWLKKRTIVRAFEVEHTTSVYSGILRMADLLALQSNMDIRLHIVAPKTRRDKVLQEIARPIFSLLARVYRPQP